MIEEKNIYYNTRASSANEIFNKPEFIEWTEIDGKLK